MPKIAPAGRKARALLAASLVVVLLITGVAVLLAKDFFQTFSCASPPSPRQQLDQQAFVTAHLPDANDFEWTVLDCDDRGQAYLAFITYQRAATASQAFLRDPACRASKEPDASAGDVICGSYGLTVYIDLTNHGAIEARGNLSPRLS